MQKVANKKPTKDIDYVRVILNKIHLSFPSFILGILPFSGLVIVKKQIDVRFLCVCPIIADKFRHCQ